MIAKPPHNRRLGLYGAALTMKRNNRHIFKAAPAVQDEVEKAILDSGYLDGAPFYWVTIGIRYGLKNDDAPRYRGIDKKYGSLDLAIEVDTHDLIDASLEEVKLVFQRAVLKALIHAGKKFERPTELLEEMLSSLPE